MWLCEGGLKKTVLGKIKKKKKKQRYLVADLGPELISGILIPSPVFSFPTDLRRLNEG